MIDEVDGEAPVRVLVTGEETYGSLAMLEMHLRRDASAPCHTHAREDEIVYVLEGHLTFTLRDATVDAPAGSCLTLPRNGEHSYRVISDEARLLTIVTPAGLEGFYREIATPDSLPVEQLVCLAARYGITITGPAA
jgi:quercetin dioxygenase-like cupin family protein